MTKAATTLKNTERRAGHTARKAASQPWMEPLTRLGYVVRGIIYIILGVLAVQLVFGRPTQQANLTGVIEVIGANPFGKALLIIVAIGLVGYTLWGFIRAFLDPLHRGDDAEGIAERLGFIASAFGYATLLVATVQYLAGAALSTSGPQDWSVKLLSQPFGRIVVGIIGFGWLLGGGLWQIYDGLQANFVRDLKLRKMTRREETLVEWAGRIGIPARGIVFGLMGLFLIQAAVQSNPGAVKGFDGALLTLLQQPYGPYLLGVVGLGLMVFGVYSILDAIWMHVEVARTK